MAPWGMNPPGLSGQVPSGRWRRWEAVRCKDLGVAAGQLGWVGMQGRPPAVSAISLKKYMAKSTQPKLALIVALLVERQTMQLAGV